MKIAVLVFAVPLLVGCINTDAEYYAQQAAYRRAMQSWIGRDRHALIMAWGPPAQEVSDGKDGHILIWNDFRVQPGYSTTNVTSNRYTGAQATTETMPPTLAGYSRMMYLDANDVVYYWRTR